jgi:hypothetical protein
MAADSSADDRAAVIRTALDYSEGWFDGDAARIERVLHPELAKRSLGRASSGTERLATLTARQMVEATARGEGKRDAEPGPVACPACGSGSRMIASSMAGAVL